MKPLRDLAPYEDDPRGRMGGPVQANAARRNPAGNPEQAFFHFDLLRALEMHRKLAGGIFLAALLLSAAYVAKRWKSYKAESLVYVQPAPGRVLETGQARDSWPFDANTYESYIQQQIHNVTRADVLAAAAKKIDGFRNEDESDQAAAARLGGNLEVTRVSTGYQLSIVATSNRADEAAQMANAVAQSFIDGATRELRSGDVQRLELLRDERDRVQKELASDRTEQDSLNRQLGVATVTAAPDPYDDQIAAVRTELVHARTDNDEAAAKLMATAGGGPSSAALDAAADQIVAADPGLVSMKTALNKRRSDLISQMANLTPNHPLYKQDADELAKINASLDTMSKDLRAKAAAQISQTLKSDLERTSSVEARLNAQLNQLTSAAGSATPRLQRSNDLATDISRLQARFTTVDEQYRNLSMENAAPGGVYLSAAAVPPLHPDHKKVYRNAAIVLLMGLVFALGAALIAHNLDPRIYIGADVKRVLGYDPMAMLPDFREVETGIAEEYMLRLAAAVEHAHQQGNLHSCIFTGVTPGAGTTTVSTRVNAMLHAMGRETMLVDAVGAPPPPRENIHPGSEMVHSPRGSRSTALLQQMHEEANEDTIVVTDTAPLLVSGETEYLARFVDSAIVVIESGVTTKSQLLEVAQTLERLDVAAAGFVLNRISLTNANPRFRQSVRAVEKHLKSQARSFDRPRSRGWKFEDEPAKPPKPPSPPAYNWENMPEPPANPEPAPPRAFEWTRSADARPAPQPAVAPEPNATTWQTALEASAGRADVLEEPAKPEPRELDWLGEETVYAAANDTAEPEKPEPGVVDWLGEETVHAAANVTAEPAKPEPRELDWLGEETVYAAANDTAAPARNDASFDRRSPAEPPAVPAAPAPDDRDLLSYFRRPDETPRIDEEPQRGLPDYLRWTTDEFHAQAATPNPAEAISPAPAPSDDANFAMRNEARSAPAVPARPKRGREGVRTRPDQRPDQRPPAPAAQDAPDAWRAAMLADAERATMHAEAERAAMHADVERAAMHAEAERAAMHADVERAAMHAEAERAAMHADAEAPTSRHPEETPEAVPENPWPIPDLPAQRTSPFAESRNRPEEPPSLQEWWSDPAHAAQASPSEAHAAGEPRASVDQPAPEVDVVDESLARAASRLGGLRNLLVTLGIQHLHQGAEQRKADLQAEHRVPERAIYAQPAGPDSNGERNGPEVTARPEIIPPRIASEFAEHKESPRIPKPATRPPQVTRWDSPDDVEILPSRRGQYRHKH